MKRTENSNYGWCLQTVSNPTLAPGFSFCFCLQLSQIPALTSWRSCWVWSSLILAGHVCYLHLFSSKLPHIPAYFCYLSCPAGWTWPHSPEVDHFYLAAKKTRRTNTAVMNSSSQRQPWKSPWPSTHALLKTFMEIQYENLVITLEFSINPSTIHSWKSVIF